MTYSLFTSATSHPSLHLRDAHDAHVILEAVRLGMLPLIKRRLSANERDQLVSGNVYVWEEAENDGGLLRWTDGRRWSQSRMRGDYLFYEEKVETTPEEREAKAVRRALRLSDPSAFIGAPTRRRDRPSKPNGLTKQTYSALVCLPGHASPRKWHVVAYFSNSDFARLPVIEDYDSLRNIQVPDGVFVSSKGGMRPEKFSFSADSFPQEDSDDLSFSQRRRATSLYNSTPPSGLSSNSSSANSSPVQSHSSLSPKHDNRLSLPRLSDLNDTLTGLSLKHTMRFRPRGHSVSGPTGSVYTPLTKEDRRVLDSLRISL